MSYDDRFTDNKLYALIWILVACLLCCALFKGCEWNSRDTELRAMKDESERNAASFALRECTEKGGTMFSGQCVICAGAK